MLENEIIEPNNEQHSEPVLNQYNAQENKPVYKLWKRAVLLGIGLVGLEIIAIFVTLFCFAIPKSDRSAAVDLITYSLLTLSFVGFVFMDIPKFRNIFKGWKPYVFGLAFGIGMLITDIAYLNFVNLFYTIETGGNETGVRSVIDLYPIASIFILGILGPLCEELTYRVGLFGLLRKVNRVLAYSVTALVFGFLHFDWTSSNLINELIILPTYVGPGALLALAYDLFGLPCSWLAHSVNNLWAVIAHIITSKM